MHITLEIFNKTPYNTDGALINCLPQPGMDGNSPNRLPLAVKMILSRFEKG
jgi:hypothetical protein